METNKIFLVILLFFPHLYASGQSTYQLDNAESSVIIKGSSNLHGEWVQQVEKMSGTAYLEVEQGEVKDINNVRIKFNVNSMESGKNMMDNKTRKALNADEYPYITFELQDLKNISDKQETQLIEATGILTIAGNSKVVQITVKGNKEEGQVVFSGEKTINMRDFGIEPPTALLGSLKTDEMVTIYYNLLFDKS